MNNDRDLYSILKASHKPGLKGILRIQSWDKFRKKLPFQLSVIGTIFSAALFYYSPKSYYEILSFLLQLTLSILPNLLGFSLGGYALIIGFGNSSMIKEMTKKLEHENCSLFQKLSAIFAFGLVLQIISLTNSIFINIAYNLNLSVFDKFTCSKNIYPIINFLACILLIFPFYWALFIVPYIVTNIFSFGQVYHMFLTIDRIKDDNKGMRSSENEEPDK
ncbi:hypothetical protein SAMN05444266_104362 [Chitinophaga jiangningensis]|uniref:Uncharacterized protein n=1 Tax=Chitinophaga jiangningensis TaxID=1419482 RepID=A0A1M7CKB0_9BACT|nr:hypothetical protein [Chitinophaga jiangningensis]SHL67573.1 hypothetical protein SAMN05444266_104362 [Chitinophaga jiangningensis]